MTHEQGLKDSYDISHKDLKAFAEFSRGVGEIKHGVDGWGLEIYTRVEDGDAVYGEYLYENEKTREVRKVTRYLGRRAP